MGYWMENAFSMKKGEPGHVLVDLGYVSARSARDRADRLLKLVGRKNLELAGAGRLLIRIPPPKVARVLAAFPEITPAAERPGYCWTTHSWFDQESTDLKHAAH
jgi:hypothetical protein